MDGMWESSLNITFLFLFGLPHSPPSRPPLLASQSPPSPSPHVSLSTWTRHHHIITIAHCRLQISLCGQGGAVQCSAGLVCAALLRPADWRRPGCCCPHQLRPAAPPARTSPHSCRSLPGVSWPSWSRAAECHLNICINVASTIMVNMKCLDTTGVARHLARQSTQSEKPLIFSFFQMLLWALSLHCQTVILTQKKKFLCQHWIFVLHYNGLNFRPQFYGCEGRTHILDGLMLLII